MGSIELVSDENIASVILELKKIPSENGLALQDLMRFREGTQVYFTEKPFSYLHVSGHPANRGSKTLSMGGDPTGAMELLKHANPQAPFTVRETDSKFASAVKEYYPQAISYDEFRMDVTREKFRPQHQGAARQLNDGDLEALCEFFGAPKQAAEKFRGWLMGAKSIFGVFAEGKLVSIGSSFVAIPDVWNLVGIETKTPFRKKGYATEVTSSLTAKALEETNVVTLTVLRDNIAAVKTYEKLGFEKCGNRVWLDCGAGSKP